ncbi:hypothetical protein B484DRAFT_364655 [Ochromonadaceae sp. CCMP2298]|nr:hypothetical protein B484DRAFT_364655 [Ochromonadaceae sp. CCMP2298]
MSDTYISSNSLKAALCASGVACRAVDIAVCNDNTNVFACTRPPGHHAGRYGCTGGCLSTGFCLLNNAAIAAIYARVRWGLERVAVVDIDVHFGNGTAELLKDDPQAFFASVHMIYGEDNDGTRKEEGKPRPSSSAGFYPSTMGTTEARTFVGSEGFLEALRDVIIPKMEAFNPQLLIISSGFDGYVSDPLGGQLCLSLEDYKVATKMLMQSMAKLRSNTDSGTISGRVISVLEGGYDTAPGTLGLARCVDAHVQALQEG